MGITTNNELKSLAKSKGLLVESTHGLYNAYIHITADDSEGLDGRSPDEYNITIMTVIDPAAEQAAREAAKAALEHLPAFENTKKRKSKKRLDKNVDFEDNDDSDELSSETETNAKNNLAARLN